MQSTHAPEVSFTLYITSRPLYNTQETFLNLPKWVKTFSPVFNSVIDVSPVSVTTFVFHATHALPVAEAPAKTSAPLTLWSSSSASSAKRLNFATLEAQISSAHCMTSATSLGTSSGFSSARIKRLARTVLSMLNFLTPSLCVVINARASSPTRSITHCFILEERTDVIMPSAISLTSPCTSSNSASEYLTAALQRGTSTRNPLSLMRSFTW